MYKRRDTPSLAGPLYEMKLISLLYLRAFLDDTIEEFQLAANVDHMDLFGNICFKAKMKGIDKPVAVFIQVKYRPKKNITYISHLEKSFCSYLKIRQQFNPSNDNLFLQGEYNETECFFVIYSNAIINFKTVVHGPRESAIPVKLKDLIGTGGTDEQIYDQQNVDFLCEVAIKKQMISLAERIAGLLNHDANFKMLLADEIMQLYHVILAQKVIKVSEIQPDGHRIAFFRSEFFDTHEEYLIIFRDALYKVVQMNKDITEQNKNELIELLQYHRFKVPAAFGNKDLTIRGDDAKIERRLNYLASNIYKSFENCNTSGKDTIVTVDESLAESFLQLNGGIAGTIGNIFVLDDNSKLMKITDRTEQLEPLAKRLYTKIKNEVPNLHEYKFNFKVNKFPKLSFDFDQHEKQLARDFLNRLVLYYNQGDMYNVECILENEIQNYQCVQPTSFQAKTNVAFLRYCDHMQKWWMSPENATVLTRETGLLEKSMNKIEDILISEINANYMSKIKQYNYTFTETAVRSLKLQKHSNTIIITENSILTVVKVIQHLNDKDYVVLNFEYIANLPTNDRTALRRELKYTNYDKVLILVCDDIQQEKINTLGIFTVPNRSIMIVTNQTSFKTVQKNFPAYIILYDKKFCLTDLTEESQMSIFKTATVIFPGVEEEIKLDLLLTKPASRSVGDAAADDKTGIGFHRTAISYFVFWPNASVPFYINPEHFDVDQTLEIRKGLAQVAFKTCIKLAPVLAAPNSNEHVMTFVNPEGLKRCKIELDGHSSSKPHEIVVGYECLKAPEINMIILRALGMPFEHNRMVRDDHIEVMVQNVEPHYVPLFTKSSIYPDSIERMPYDINSVMHFGERDYSKNGYRTIVFKGSKVQNRNALTKLDVLKLNLIYGTQCRERDRAEKIDICQSYPGVGRRKREVSEPPANMSLRVNPNITPPPHIVAGITEEVTEKPKDITKNNTDSKDSLKILAIEKEADKITELVYQLSVLALKNANEKYCNKSKKIVSEKTKNDNITIDVLGVLQTITDFTKTIVDEAVGNLTDFCQNSETIEDYQRQCKSHNDTRCRIFFKTSCLTADHQLAVRNKDIDITSATLKPNRRKKRETTYKENTTKSEEKKVENVKEVKKEEEKNLTDKIKLMKEERLKEIQKADATVQPESGTSTTVSKVKDEKEKATRRKFTDKRYKHDGSDWDESDTSLEKKNLEPEKTLKNKKLLQKVLAEGANAILRKEKEAEGEVDSGNAEKTGKSAESSERNSDTSGNHKTEEESGDEKANKVPLEEIDVDMDDEPQQRNNQKAERTHKTGKVPKTVALSKLNQEFYHERKWPDGDVIYVIAKLKDYDLEDVRKRLAEINNILLEKTCVRLREVDAKEAPGFDDYIILDNSPDYVTGRVGRKQNFGCIELFEGGQHRQHTAMVVMAMLGFYFEVSRHDRDKHIRVHNRHIRADKLHHFEKLNEEATLNIPYDYKSATHPAWQFWRKVGHKGISTIATYKDLDPDGAIMRSLGQNPELLSESDILKINSVYGVECFQSKRSSDPEKKDFERMNDEEVIQ